MLANGPRAPLIGSLFIIWVLAAFAPASQAFVLVSPDEVARERAKGDPMGSLRFRGSGKEESEAPEIVLVNPVTLTNIPSPLNIELKFLPKSPSKIVHDSLRVLYGFFGFNVTDRLTGHAEITPSGILARDATLPPGSHSITIEISDDQNRIARKTFQFVIRE